MVKLYSTNTNARKMQQKQELHNVQRKNLNINEYSLKVKGLADSLASIGALVVEDLKNKCRLVAKKATKMAECSPWMLI